MDDTLPRSATTPVRYVLESELGLLVNITEERGEHLVIWTSREAANLMVPAFVGAGTYRVIEMSASELHEELTGMRDDGMRFILLDPQVETDGHLMPIEEAITVYGRLAEPVSETTGHADHFLQRLDRARSLGQSLDADADQIPIDCPLCRAYITLPEADYRAWRNGRREVVRCPKCLGTFRDAEFSRVRCDDCGQHSGEMPASLARALSRGEHPWRCMDCGDKELRRLAAEKTKKKSYWSEVNWYSVIVGGLGLAALLGGLYVKFVLMAE